ARGNQAYPRHLKVIEAVPLLNHLEPCCHTSTMRISACKGYLIPPTLTQPPPRENVHYMDVAQAFPYSSSSLSRSPLNFSAFALSSTAVASKSATFSSHSSMSLLLFSSITSVSSAICKYSSAAASHSSASFSISPLSSSTAGVKVLPFSVLRMTAASV